VPVEVASGTVVVLGGARVGVPGKDLGIAEGDAMQAALRDKAMVGDVDAARRSGPSSWPGADLLGLIVKSSPSAAWAPARWPCRPRAASCLVSDSSVFAFPGL
jgi:hypothetical protein